MMMMMMSSDDDNVDRMTRTMIGTGSVYLLELSCA